MSYDAAGNLTYDTHTSSPAPGTRFYDGEGRMTAAYYTNNQLASAYTYDADGRRTRRKILGSEVWQVYGIDGELLAEYAASAATSAPQKEYGYRNGELLVTAESGGQVNWLVSDHLGTPRIVADLSGTLANTKRHDYLPFGEELFAGTGGRTTGQGYVADNVRQQFTGYERDDETGLDYAQARYYASAQGRFSSPDPLLSSGSIYEPQTWNRYAYVMNNPLRHIDPTGMEACRDASCSGSEDGEVNKSQSEMDYEKRLQQTYEAQHEQQEEQEQSDTRPYIGDMVSPNQGVGTMSDGSFRFKVNENGSIGHDGEHVLGDPNGSSVSAIQGLTGKVLTYYSQGGDLYTVYIQINKQAVMVLKDIQNPSAKIKQAPSGRSNFLDKRGNAISKINLRVGDLIGHTAKWSGPTNKGQVGLHFTFVKFENIQQYRTNIANGRGSPAAFFVSSPCGSSSPARCR